jgi:hypothetical protein
MSSEENVVSTNRFQTYKPGDLSMSAGLSGIKLLTSVEQRQDPNWDELFRFEGVFKDDI